MFLTLMAFIVPFMGSWIWLQGRLQAAQFDARAHMAFPHQKKDLVLWKFTAEEAAAQLFWEHSREFEFRGEMYDVVRSETKGDTTWYWCYHDQKETRVKKSMASFLSRYLGSGPCQQRDQERLQYYFRTLFVSRLGEIESLAMAMEIAIPVYQATYPMDILHLPYAPPPEFS